MRMQCELQLDNPHQIYHPGDLVSGLIVVQLHERELLKALGLEVSGYATTAWIKPSEQKKKSQQANDGTPQPQTQIQGKAYENRVDYLSTTNYFIGSEAANERIIECGVYQYNFSVRLPEHCPSSYEGEFGHIRYTLQLFMHANNDRHVVFSRTLAVERLRDLREQTAVLSNARETQSLEQTSAMKFWQKPLQLEINIPRGGYTPGEYMSVHVKVRNPQNLPLSELIYKINLVTTHIGLYKQKRRETKLERRNLLTSTHQLGNIGVEAKASLLQHLQTLQVPHTPPTLTAAECECLQLDYELEVLVKTTQAKRMAQIQLPITIGSISLTSAAGVGSALLQHEPDLAASVAILKVTRSLEDLMTVPTAPPLTPTEESAMYPNLSASMNSLATEFREADFMTATNLNKREKHTMAGKQIDYRPKYLVYDMNIEEVEKVA